jgi:3-deoxy-D-manno-octulosonate 8-phosphate phosphatase (KDO 8-P phosphatase)
LALFWIVEGGRRYLFEFELSDFEFVSDFDIRISDLSRSSVPQATLHERCSKIDLLVADVDGVLTDGSIMYADNDVEVKVFHVRDGSGLKLWHLAGKRSALLSGRTSKAVAVRAAELGVDTVLQGTTEKLPAFERLLQERGLVPEQACFVADDLPDLPVLRRCGLAVAVADACAEVAEDAHYVTCADGGRGAIRETIELILRAQGLWQTIVAGYRT